MSTTTVFASGLNRPVGLAFDASGICYCASDTAGTIIKITSNGTVSTFVSGLNTPGSLAFDSLGNLYSTTDNQILKITSDGTVTTFATVNQSQCLAFDTLGNLYCGTYSGFIKKITSSGNVSQIASNLNPIFGLAFNSSGTLYAGNQYGDIWIVPTNGGTPSIFISASVGLGNIQGLAFDNLGNLYSSSYNQYIIYKITITGVISTFANSDVGIKSPTSLAFNSLGNLYCSNIVDRNILTSGYITVTGLPTPTLSNFYIPQKTYGDAPFIITDPSSNSSGSFSYTSSNTSVADISGNIITIVGVGNSIITATQAATNNFNSGTISTTFQVNKITPVLGTITVPINASVGTTFEITAPTSTSPGSFSYTSSNLAVATISGNIATVVDTGESIISAIQAETTYYASATVTSTLIVPVIISNANELVNFMNTTTATYGNITNSIELNTDLIAVIPKVLINTSDNNLIITIVNS